MTTVGCEYVNGGDYIGSCRQPATHVVSAGRRNHPLCNEHAAPKWHPSDLRRRIFAIDSEHQPDCEHLSSSSVPSIHGRDR